MIFMVVEISDYLSRVEAAQYTIFTQKFHASVHKTLSKYNAIQHKSDNNSYWINFKSVNDAIQCALDIQHKFKYVTPKHESFQRRLNIALTTSSKATEDLFEHTEQICEMTNVQIVISTPVRDLYKSKNSNALIDDTLIKTLSPSEETFLSELTKFMVKHWERPDLNVKSLTEGLDMSYSNLYRRMLKLNGKTPLKFINDYKLHKALDLLYTHQWTITEIAKKTGFSSLSYFSECFLRKYGIRPSTYLKQHI
ncbi:helix-turn-helix transcriptional regulator [uncultured Winogradskyella sp.]|uniref:helix-turn-helix transcriptional regulator n=1 Tax=uncultured Winogradskyella sp. TaxID=395353 RepID=UPI0035189A13